MCIIVRADAIVVFQGVRLTYTGGALHSTADAPALEIACAKSNKKVRGVYLAVSVLREVLSPEVRWVKRTLGHRESYYDRAGTVKLPNTAEESRWYDRGDLHRDYGFAIRGFERNGELRYWYKFYRGALGSGPLGWFGPLNSFGPLGSFACAPDAVVCAEVTIYSPHAVTRVYQNDTARVIATGRKADRTTHMTSPISAPIMPHIDYGSNYGEIITTGETVCCRCPQ